MSEEPGSQERSVAHPPLELAVLQRSSAWNAVRPTIEARFPLAVEAALSATAERSPGGSELSLVLADDALQRELNRTYRGIDKSTNVLAFSAVMDVEAGSPDSSAILGDIVLAFETCAAEAAAQGKCLEDHALHLAIHGLLHLLGFSHEADDDARTMEELERRILAIFDIPDPYAERCAIGQAEPGNQARTATTGESRITADG